MNKKKVFITVVSLILVIALTGCSAIGAFVGKLKGEPSATTISSASMTISATWSSPSGATR